MVQLLVGADVDCGVLRDERHLALDVGLQAQVIVWPQALGRLGDVDLLLPGVEGHLQVLGEFSTWAGGGDRWDLCRNGVREHPPLPH